MRKSNRWWWCVQGLPRAMSRKWTKEPCNYWQRRKTVPHRGPPTPWICDASRQKKRTAKQYHMCHVSVHVFHSRVYMYRTRFVHLPRVNFIIIDWIENNSFFFFFFNLSTRITIVLIPLAPPCWGIKPLLGRDLINDFIS